MGVETVKFWNSIIFFGTGLIGWISFLIYRYKVRKLELSQRKVRNNGY